MDLTSKMWVMTDFPDDPLVKIPLPLQDSFPGSSVGKESTYNAGDLGSIPGLGRFSEKGHGNPLQYSCLENPMDRGAWHSTVHRVIKSQTQLK